MFRKNNSQTRLLFAVTILAVIVTIGCAAKKNPWGSPEAGLILTYRMPEDQVLKYKMSSKYEQNLEIMGQSTKIELDKAYMLSIKSGGMVEDNHQLGITIDSMEVHVTIPQGEVPADVSTVLGKSFDMKLSPLGKEMDLSGAESIKYDLGPGEKHGIASDFQALFPNLASRPVKVADTWKSTDNIDVKEGDSETHIIMESINVLEGFETVNGMECAKITSTYTGTIDGKGKQDGMDLVTKGEIKGSDTWYFAYEEGLLVKITSNVAGEGTITGSGPQNIVIPMKLDIKSETTLVE